jgi:rhodanese-related sulfurtransferase
MSTRLRTPALDDRLEKNPTALSQVADDRSTRCPEDASAARRRHHVAIRSTVTSRATPRASAPRGTSTRSSSGAIVIDVRMGGATRLGRLPSRRHVRQHPLPAPERGDLEPSAVGELLDAHPAALMICSHFWRLGLAMAVVLRPAVRATHAPVRRSRLTGVSDAALCQAVRRRTSHIAPKPWRRRTARNPKAAWCFRRRATGQQPHRSSLSWQQSP